MSSPLKLNVAPAPLRQRSFPVAGRGSAALRLTAVMLSFLFLAACGFHPMYGDEVVEGGATPMRGNVAIETAGGGRDMQILRTALEDRFNPESLDTAGAPYRLYVGLQKARIPSVVKSDGTIQRYDVHFNSSFRLFKKGVAAPLFSGDLRRTGSYNVAVNANFATYEAEQDVTERTLKEMAEDYVLRISGLIAKDASAPGTAP